MKIKYMLSAWRTLKIPGLLPLMRDWFPFLRMHFLYAAFESGLLQALRNRATRQSLIEDLAVKRPEMLDALLDMGLALKQLKLSNGYFSLRGKKARALSTPRGDAVAAVVQANVTYYNTAYRHFTERMQGAPLGDDLQHIGETVARFAKIGEPILDSFIKSLVPASGAFSLLDVGCGSGFVLKTACGANPEARGIGIDRDEKVAAQARANIASWGLEDRISILDGDIRIHTRALRNQFNLIAAFNLIYYFPVDERHDFFMMLRSMLASGGCLALVCNFESNGRDVGAANLNIVNCSLNGLTPLPSLATVRKQLSDCGFTRITASKVMPGNEFYGIAAYL